MTKEQAELVSEAVPLFQGHFSDLGSFHFSGTDILGSPESINK